MFKVLVTRLLIFQGHGMPYAHNVITRDLLRACV